MLAKYWMKLVCIATGVTAILTAIAVLREWRPLFADDLAAVEAKLLKRIDSSDSKFEIDKAQHLLRYWSQEVRTYQIHPPRQTGMPEVDQTNTSIWKEDLNTARSNKKYYRQRILDLEDKARNR